MNSDNEWTSYDDVRLNLQMRGGQTYWYALHELPGGVTKSRWVVVRLYEGVANGHFEFPTEAKAKQWVEEHIS